MDLAHHFLHLDALHIAYLLIVGFIGGLVSGFIGSGGAFVLTPAMMSMGVPGIVAVASNICHKFPKALVGAIKRARYGQVDVKLGIVVGVSAEAGVLYGAHVQESIKEAFGNSGSNLYVSVAFVVILAIIGGYVSRDAIRTYRTGKSDDQGHTTRLARWVQSINIPGTMVYFPSLNARISILFTIPLGFATGMLAATIAVGGFIGVPGMHYLLGVPSIMASASELVVAFVMGLGGTVKYGWSGLVDIRLAMVILAGSLFGIQLGAIGTTYVKPHMIKVVMGTIMMLVLLSRALMIPVYLVELDAIAPFSPTTLTVLSGTSFFLMITGLVVGAGIVLNALRVGLQEQRRAELVAAKASPAASPVVAVPSHRQLSPLGRFESFLVASDGSEFSAGAVREAIHMAQRCGARLQVITVVATGAEQESMGEQLLKREFDAAEAHLTQIKAQATAAGIACETQVVQASQPFQEIVGEAERLQTDLIVTGRRGRRGMARFMVGDATVRIIGHAPCSVLVVPRAARLVGRQFVLATDGSRHGDAAAVVAGRLAKLCDTPLTVLSATLPGHSLARRRDATRTVNRIVSYLKQEGVRARGETAEGARADQVIVETARAASADLIVLGSHGRTGLERILLGSTAERVLDQTSCSVLVVKAS